MQRVLDGPPRPPSAAAGWTASVEVSVAHRPVALDGRLHPAQHLRVPAEPVGPAGVPDTIVEHGAPPPRQHRGRHETRGMRPVLEQEPAAVDEPVEPRAVVRAEAAPHREVVGAIEDVDGIQLEPADVFDEASEAPGGQRGRAGAAEVLPLEEERRDCAKRKRWAWHPVEGYHPVARGGADDAPEREERTAERSGYRGNARRAPRHESARASMSGASGLHAEE